MTLDDLAACRDVERGDFVQGTYLSKVTARAGPRLAGDGADRPGRRPRRSASARRSSWPPTARRLKSFTRWTTCPKGVPLHFAVEINLAGMAGHADDRYYSDASGARLGMLDARLDLRGQDGLSLTDEWLDLDVGSAWSKPADLWCFPVETVSQSEGGFEGVYQSSCVIPHWVVTADASRRWEVRIRWTASPASETRPTADDDGREARRDRGGGVTSSPSGPPMHGLAVPPETERPSTARPRRARRGGDPAAGAAAEVPGQAGGGLGAGGGVPRGEAGRRADVRRAARV